MIEQTNGWVRWSTTEWHEGNAISDVYWHGLNVMKDQAIIVLTANRHAWKNMMDAIVINMDWYLCWNISSKDESS